MYEETEITIEELIIAKGLLLEFTNSRPYVNAVRLVVNGKSIPFERVREIGMLGLPTGIHRWIMSEQVIIVMSEGTYLNGQYIEEEYNETGNS